jgi:hypothetical protein
MGNQSMTRKFGFVCPVRGCNRKKNRRFTLIGLCEHLKEKHEGELEKRLRAKQNFLVIL